MARRYRRRYARVSRPLKTVKYSNETMNLVDDFEIAPKGSQRLTTAWAIIPAISTQGMRKCKNFTLHIETQSEVPLLFVLAYVPQGQTPGTPNIGVINAQGQGVVSLYEPNQNVIMSGMLKADSPQLTFRTRLARNLNSGDSVALIVTHIGWSGDAAAVTRTLAATLNYAITY